MRPFTFSLFIVSFIVITHTPLVFAKHGSHAGDITAEKAAIIESALEALLREHKHELANRFVAHHLDGTVYSSRFLHLAVISYLRSGKDENAFALLLMARHLYPNDEVFIYELVLFHAERGRCEEALAAWADYKRLVGEPLAEHRQARLYSYCPKKWVLNGGIIAFIEGEDKGHQNETQQNIKAHEGSYLSQLCTAITGLCPADHQFTVNRPQRRETTLAIGLNYIARRLVAERDELQIHYRQTHHLTSPQQQSAALSLSLQRYQNPRTTNGVSLGVHHRFIPSHKGGDMRRNEDVTLEINRQIKLARRLSQQLKASYITGRDRLAGYRGYGFGLSYHWRIDEQVSISAAVHTNRFIPAQIDLLGAYHRDGYRLSSHVELHPDFLLAISMSRSDTHYEKTLPYLTRPHQLTDRQQKIDLIYKGAVFGQFRPYISLTHHKSKSENELQSGKSRFINFGLTASF